MSPLRLIVLAALIYIGYRLVISSFGKKNKGEGNVSREPADPAVVDVLVEDPVCHTLVPQRQAIRLRHHEEMIYFCSEKCCESFVKEQGETK